jgi:hypothetical protein
MGLHPEACKMTGLQRAGLARLSRVSKVLVWRACGPDAEAHRRESAARSLFHVRTKTQKEENRAVNVAGVVMGRVWSLGTRTWPPLGGRMRGHQT